MEKVMTINRPPEDFAQFKQDFADTYHIEAMMPTATTGKTTPTQEIRNEWDAWHALKERLIACAGNVQFGQAPNGRGTEVRVSFPYSAPGGMVGSMVAKILDKSPEQWITEDLRHFKEMMEAGEIATITGQPVGSK
ncbi:MAG: hypothetical protein JO125_13960 [Chloroflexi bacterium]|nr:hypothetical protein [Ktedonobacteraceae bacterium]MBV8821845.1 hypothetical protein [Ktedonobacteraceae bacterium]MBV9021868.1 hypothetical protein [Ktedonobacteraceae bacterium]MBV9708501.1 hypothetical protein [Chloroflexota bacterium]